METEPMIVFTDANNGKAVGSNEILLHTDNGGDDWVPTYITDGSSYNASCLSFVNNEIGWVTSHSFAGGTTKVQRTIDGGINWKQLEISNFMGPAYISAIGKYEAVIGNNRNVYFYGVEPDSNYTN